MTAITRRTTSGVWRSAPTGPRHPRGARPARLAGILVTLAARLAPASQAAPTRKIAKPGHPA